MSDVPRTVRRVPWILSIVLVVIFLILSGLTVWKMRAVKKMGGEMKEAMKEGGYTFGWTHIPPLDYFLKVVHVVFVKFYLVEPIHFWWLETWMMACSALMFFQAIDFDRLSMRFVPFYVFLYQYAGIGIIWPLVMIYYLYKRNSHSGRFPGGSSRARVILTGFTNLVSIVLLASLSTLNKSNAIYFWTVNAFLLIPAIAPFFSYLLPAETEPRSVYESAQGQRFENLVYAFTAGISFLLYWRALPSLFEQYFWNHSLSHGFQLLFDHLLSNNVHVFLAYDTLASAGVMLLFVLLDGGISATLITLLSSIFVSPGAALSIYLLRRESIIYGTSTGTWTTHVAGPTSTHKPHKD